MASIKLNINKSIFNDIYYSDLFNYSRRYNVFYGSAGSGKSHYVFQKIIIKALNDVKKVLVIRKVMATQKDSCWDMALNTLSKFCLLEKCEVNKSTFTITLPNGSVFLFKGLDNPEKIKSITNITDIICEECTELTIDDVSQLDLRLRANTINLQMYFMFNPTSKASWVYKRWFDENSIVNDDTFILKTTYLDNRFLPQSYVDSLENLRLSNPTYYKIYALGEFATLDKLVYNNWKVKDFDINETVKTGKLLIGLDFGYVSDLTAIVASIFDEEAKTIYIFNEFGRTGLVNTEIASVIKSMGFSKSLIIADCAEQKSIEELKRDGITRIKACAKGKDSIMHGVQKLQQYTILVHPTCDGVITELQNYSWEKDRSTGEYINKPIDRFNHFMDALRYSLQCVQDNKLRTLNKNILGL